MHLHLMPLSVWLGLSSPSYLVFVCTLCRTALRQKQDCPGSHTSGPLVLWSDFLKKCKSPSSALDQWAWHCLWAGCLWTRPGPLWISATGMVLVHWFGVTLNLDTSGLWDINMAIANPWAWVTCVGLWVGSPLFMLLPWCCLHSAVPKRGEAWVDILPYVIPPHSKSSQPTLCRLWTLGPPLAPVDVETCAFFFKKTV